MSNAANRSYAQGQEDRVKGRRYANLNLIFTPADPDAYRKGYEYQGGLMDGREGRRDKNGNLFFTPSDPEAYRNGYKEGQRQRST